MKCFLIYNPTSRQGKSRRDFDKIVSILSENKANFDYVLTSQKDEAIDLSKRTNIKNYDVVVATGGDGTICEVITGLMSKPEHERQKLGILHIGTSPDFNRYHHLPTKLEDAVKVLLNGKSRKVDVGKVICKNKHDKDDVFYFGSSVNIGLGPSIASKSNGRYRKYLGDFLGTLSSTLISLATFNPINLGVKVNGKTEEFQNVFNLTIGKDPYLASGMRIPMELEEDNGQMYMLAIQGKHKIPLLANLWRLYAGNILDYKGSTFKFCKEVEISGNKNERLEFDGDFRGYLPAKIDVLPKSLEILVR